MKTNFESEPLEDERDNHQRETDSRNSFAERVRRNQHKENPDVSLAIKLPHFSLANP